MIHFMPQVALLTLVLAFSTARASDSAQIPVPTSAHQVRPLLIGASVPQVDLLDGSGKTVSIGGPSERPRIFLFYRGGW